MDVFSVFLLNGPHCCGITLRRHSQKKEGKRKRAKTPPPTSPLAGPTRTSLLTLEYMAPLRTSPLRIQMMEAAGFALSAWQVRLRGSPARRLTTGPPPMTGFSGGTGDTNTMENGRSVSAHCWIFHTLCR